MDRRRLLQAIGATGVATFSAGCSGLWEDDAPPPTRSPTAMPDDGPPPTDAPSTSTPGPSGYADRFGTVVNLAKAGADTGAGESIVPLLEEHLADDTLVYLPSGRYRMDALVRHVEFDNFGIVGDDAVIVPPDGHDSTFFDIGRPGRASNLLFEGITFDFRAKNTGARPLSAQVDDGLVVRDLAVKGTQDAGNGMLRVDVTSPEGSGLVERLHLPDGAAVGTSSNGCFVGDGHRGVVRLKDCRIVGFPDNGLYGDPERGTVEVVGGLYANSDISNVRVGNDSVVRGVHIRCDDVPDAYENVRGIRLTHGADVLVEDCEIEMRNVPSSGGGITFGNGLAAATVRNTDITVDVDSINAMQLKPPSGDVPVDGRFTFEGVDVRGSAANEVAIEVQVRENCVFDRCSVVQQGANRDGFWFEHGSNGVIRNSRIDVTGRPVVSAGQSSVRVVDSKPPGVNTDPTG